jgi:hypothetical protein
MDRDYQTWSDKNFVRWRRTVVRVRLSREISMTALPLTWVNAPGVHGFSEYLRAVGILGPNHQELRHRML